MWVYVFDLHRNGSYQRVFIFMMHENLLLNNFVVNRIVSPKYL